MVNGSRKYRIGLNIKYNILDVMINKGLNKFNDIFEVYNKLHYETTITKAQLSRNLGILKQNGLVEVEGKPKHKTYIPKNPIIADLRTFTKEEFVDAILDKKNRKFLDDMEFKLKAITQIPSEVQK